MGYDPLSVSEKQFITFSIIYELYPNTTPYIRLKLALDAKKLTIHPPSKTSLERVRDAACKVGDLAVLSQADKEILAVALDLSESGYSPQLVSDDYAVQNVADLLNINYTSLTTFGIRYRFRWILYCPGCKRRYAPDTGKTVCKICGTQLKRRVFQMKGAREKSL